MGGCIDHGDAIGRTECNEPRLAIPRDVDADRLDRLRVHAGDRKDDLRPHLVFDRIDDTYRSADLRRYPQFGAVVLELSKTRACIDQNIGHDLAGGRIDEMRHIGSLGGVHEYLPVRSWPMFWS